MTTTYLATVTRNEGVWIVDIDGLPSSYFSMTEVRKFSDLDLEVRDLIAGLTETEPDSFGVDWRVLFGDTDVTKWLTEIEHAETQISAWEDQRSELRGEVIRVGRAAGLSQGVIGEVLHLSQQRVAQVERQAAEAEREAAGEEQYINFDEYWAEQIQPRVALMHTFADRVNADGHLVEEDLRAVGEACTWMEDFLSNTNFHGAPEEIEKVIGPLRGATESLRRFLENNVTLDFSAPTPDDASGLFVPDSITTLDEHHGKLVRLSDHRPRRRTTTPAGPTRSPLAR